MSKVTFSEKGWEDYLYWKITEKSTLRKINNLIKDINKNGLSNGTGNPELFKYRKEWSRQISPEDRLVYNSDGNGNLIIISCRGHYEG